jgi:hypothetical protein
MDNSIYMQYTRRYSFVMFTLSHFSLSHFTDTIETLIEDQSALFAADIPMTLPRKAKWDPSEDEQLRFAVAMYGTVSWNKVATLVPTRNGKQCRERWVGQLAPTVTKYHWIHEEDIILIRGHAINGNSWSAIAAKLPGRSPLSVKNRWYWLMRHQAPMLMQYYESAKAMGRRDIVENKKNCPVVFQPLNTDDELFGAGFEEFRVKMLLGQN